MRPAVFLLAVVLSGFLSGGAAGSELPRELDVSVLRGLRGPVAALLATGIDGGGLSVSGLAWRVPAEGNLGARAAFRLDLALPVRVGERQAIHEIELYAYALDVDGQVRDFLARSVRWEEAHEEGLSVRLSASLALASEAGMLRLLVVEPQSLAYRLWVIPTAELAEGAEIPATGAALIRMEPRMADLSPESRSTAAAEVGPSLPSELPPRKRKRLKVLAAAVRDGYRRALEQLAAGVSAVVAAETLANAELAVFRAESTLGVRAGREAERRTAEELGRLDPEVLLPMALLHFQVFRLFVGREENFLADQARRSSARLAEDFAARSTAESAGRLASEVMLSLASETTVRPERRRLLDRALALAGRSDALSLLVAATAEREAAYQEAVVVLTELLRRNPGQAEARLRLAVNLHRLGQADEAESHLERLLADQHADWLLTLAYQELARWRFAAGHGTEAVLLLRRALERYPRASRLSLQLAWMLDRLGAGAEARDLMARARQPWPGESARYRYSGWPEPALEQIRRSLVEQSRLRNAALVRALAAIRGIGPELRMSGRK